MIDKRKIGIFLGIAFGGPWLIAIGYAALGFRWGGIGASVVGPIYMLFPMAATFIVLKAVYKEPVMQPLGISFKVNRWWVVGWLLPLVISLATLGISLWLPGVEFSVSMDGLYARLAANIPPEQIAVMKEKAALLPVHPFWLALLQGLIAGVTINAGFGFGEELGWRGFLQKEFSGLGFWKGSLFIGLVWGIWHAPLVLQGHNYHQHPKAGVLLMTAWCMLLGPLFSYIRIRSGSVIAAAIMHGSLNAFAGLGILVVTGGSDLTVGVTGLGGFIVLAVLNILLFVYLRSGGTLSPKPVT
jgi:membrane protease YdiL (CAAX protease family)